MSTLLSELAIFQRYFYPAAKCIVNPGDLIDAHLLKQASAKYRQSFCGNKYRNGNFCPII